MKTQIKQKWVDALRSGDYQQGESRLFDGKNYCCLGVLCDIYRKETNNEDWTLRYSEFESHDKWYFAEQSEVLPENVMDWAGLTEVNPTIYGEENCNGEEIKVSHDIASLNDSGYNFKELSNYIEEQL